MRNKILLNNSRIKHHLETFNSASVFRHATLPIAPSTDEVTSGAIHKLGRPRLLSKNWWKKGFYITTQEFSSVGKHLPQHPRSHMQHYRGRRCQMRLQVGKLVDLKNLDFYKKNDEKVEFHLTKSCIQHLFKKNFLSIRVPTYNITEHTVVTWGKNAKNW